jgi:ubiquinone/menaquinone biosynthesis C-methylase UbiE
MSYIKDTINFYDQNVDEYIKNTTNLQNKDWIDKFISYLPKNGSVLDIGCAYGRDTNFFASKKYVTTGIDLSQKMIDKAKESVPDVKFFVMNMLELDFEDNAFDGVWCSATLLHLKKADAIKSLKEIKRVLKVNGVLYFNLKEGEGEKTINDDRYDNAKKFYAYYNEKEIKDILSEQSFELLDFKNEKESTHKYVNTGIMFIIAKNK